MKLNYSYLSDLIGSNLDALMAGNIETITVANN